MTSTKSNVTLDRRYDRVIVLIDMDCFYCQVEEKLNPELEGKPIAVVQYNAWRGGGIIAVNYPAREKGVTRHMRGEEAQEHCPDINLVRVPNVREKADLTKYREAGKKVAEVLQTYTPLLERASVDEAYLDLTEQVKIRLKEMNDGTYKIKPNALENTFAVGYETVGIFIHEISSSQSDLEMILPEFHENEIIDPILIQKYNLNLLIGSSMVSEIRAKVKEKTGYDCSAGIAHNKILAKLSCGLNKPNKQTILPINEIQNLLNKLPIHKIKGLGGKFGEEIIEELKVKTIGDLLKFSKNELQRIYDEKNGNWLFLIARGIDLEAVTPRFYSKSIGCCKKFPGRNAITGLNTLNHWLQELANEISDRLDKDVIENNRKAKQIVVSFVQEINSTDVSSSRSANLLSYEADIIAKSSLELIQKNTNPFLKTNSKCLNYAIKFLGISVGKFENISSGQSTLQEMFSKQKQKENKFLEEKPLEISDKKCENIKDTNDEILERSNQETFSQNCEIVNENIKTDNIEPIENSVNNALKNESPKLQNKSNIETNFRSHCEQSDVIQQESNPNNLEQLNIPSGSHFTENLDYTKSYAEYALIQQSEDFIKCSECGTKILSINLQTHLDGHLAFKLSQQLRDEYRNDLKARASKIDNKKVAQLNNSVNSKNSSKKQSATSPLCNITKYLKTTQKTTLTDMKNCVKCSECGCFVDELKIVEHNDLHFAQKIQREWNQT